MAQTRRASYSYSYVFSGDSGLGKTNVLRIHPRLAAIKNLMVVKEDAAAMSRGESPRPMLLYVPLGRCIQRESTHRVVKKAQCGKRGCGATGGLTMRQVNDELGLTGDRDLPLLQDSE